MAISFPANPNENDSFTSNGKTWVWSGGRWKIVGASNRGLSLEISDAAPSNPVQGDMWYESDSGRTYTYYDNVWIELGNTSAVYSFIADDDSDTLIQVEESADEDVIRFDVGGVEKAVLDSSGLSITGDIEVSGSYVGLSSDSVRDADNDTKVEVEVTADSDAIRFTTASTPRFEVTSAGHIVPSEDVTYDLGSSSYRFRDLYLSGNTIDLGGATISYDGTNLHMGAIKMDPSGTGANMMPSGTTAERPASPTAGMFRFNETTGEPEWYSSALGDWVKFQNGPTVTISYLVVAGGGSSGAGPGGMAAGGGGAGGLLSGTTSILPGSYYDITIGAGGIAPAPTANTDGTNGSNSLFDTFIAVGGGYGATFSSNGGNGGSGGGAAGRNNNTVGGSPTAGQGYAGGNGNTGQSSVSTDAGGGGGGAGGAGSNATDFNGGAGGIGAVSNILTTTLASTYSVGEISGSDVYFAGGGGGGAEAPGTIGSGGLGGGGDAAYAASNATGQNGAANTGGGGGGAGGGSSNTGGNGGSGITILRYPSSRTLAIDPGLTSSTSVVGSDRVTIITAGTGTVSWT